MKAPGDDTHLQISVLRTRRGFQRKYRSLGQKGGQGAAVQAGSDPRCPGLAWFAPGVLGCTPPHLPHQITAPPPLPTPTGLGGGEEKGGGSPQTHPRSRCRPAPSAAPPGACGVGGRGHQWGWGKGRGPGPPPGGCALLTGWGSVAGCSSSPFLQEDNSGHPPGVPSPLRGEKGRHPPNSPVMFWDGFWGRCPASWAPTSPGEGDEGGLQAPLQPAVAVDEVCHVLRLGQRGCLDG